MKVTNSTDRIRFQPETLEDVSTLESFPGLDKDNYGHHCPIKGPVLRNLLDRLKRLKPKTSFKLDQSLLGLLEPGKLRELPESFSFKTKPLEHQLIALRFLYTNGGGGLLLDPGLGKTKICLDYIHLCNFSKVLVICPKALMFVWEEEIGIHRPELSYHLFETTDTSQLTAARKKRVWVVNYAKATLLQELLLKENFDAIFVDEGLVKDPSSDQTKAITALSRKIPIRVIMSGTLVNNTEADIYSPVRILEPSLVGWSYAKFRDTYFSLWKPYANDPTKKHIVVVSGAKDPKLLRDILRSCSVIMRKEIWLKDLPEKKFHYLPVDIPKDTLDKYYELLRNYAVTIEGKVVEVDNPLSMMAKLSQFGNGFLYLDKDDGISDLFLGKPKKKSKKSRDTFFFSKQPKLDRLSELVTSTLKSRKFILWYSMDAERVLIEKRLSELGISFTTIAGGDKDIKSKVGRFNQDPSLQVLLAQARTLNYGVTLLGKQDEDSGEEQVLSSIDPSICDMVFYSLGYSLEIFLQQQDRIHRIGQKRECNYYLLIAQTPTEAKLVSALKNKQMIRSIILENWIHEVQEQLV